MQRLAGAVATAAVALAACGGGDGERTDDEIRRAAARACTQHTQVVLLDLTLPTTPAAARRLDDRVVALERQLLSRLEAIDERDVLRPAIDARRAALAARRGGSRDASADERMRDAFERARVPRCAGFGAAALAGGPAWARRMDRLCAPFSRHAERLRRGRSRPERRRVTPLLLGTLLDEFTDRAFSQPAAPSDADFLASDAESAASRSVQPLRSLTTAILRRDRAEVGALRRQVRGTTLRGRAAWQLLDVPACERMMDAVGGAT